LDRRDDKYIRIGRCWFSDYFDTLGLGKIGEKEKEKEK